MSGSLDRVDWGLLRQQKLVLLNVLAELDRNSPTGQALRGILHLLDALQDDGAAAGHWRFPGEPVHPAATQPPASKRYYVEDDDGRHYGPMDEYEEAAGVADAIHGRIIVQEVEGPSASPEEDAEGGGA